MTNQNQYDRVPRQDRAYTNNPPASTNELLAHLRQVETRNHDLALRNGELLAALEQHAPQAAAALLPEPDYPTRHMVLDKIVERASAVAITYASGQIDEAELDSLAEAVYQNADYWELIDKMRQKKHDDYQKRAAKRKVKT